jgi:hypothetical protein
VSPVDVVERELRRHHGAFAELDADERAAVEQVALVIAVRVAEELLQPLDRAVWAQRQLASGTREAAGGGLTRDSERDMRLRYSHSPRGT